MKKVFCLTILFILLNGITAAGLAGLDEDNNLNAEGKQGSVTSGGYSIFHETMVDMTWQEVEKAAEEGAIILIAGAVIEEHGPHMSCGIDTYLGYLWCKMVRRELEAKGIKALIAPPFYWGVNSSTHVFPGTFTVRKETMKAVLLDIFNSLKSWGFNRVFYFNSHGDGGHIRTGIEAIIDARQNLNMDVRYMLSENNLQRFGVTGKEPIFLVHESPPIPGNGESKYLDIHAGARETGVVGAYFPEMVKEEIARKLPPTKLTAKDTADWVKDARRVTPLGYFGDPAAFNSSEMKENWEEECKMIAEAIAKYIEENKD